MRTVAFRVPDEIYRKLEPIKDKSDYLRRVLAKHFEVDAELPDERKEIEKIVERKVGELLGWYRLK